jgi:hypothetical protein
LTVHQVQELSIDYTNCIQNSPETSEANPGPNATLKEIPADRVSATFNKEMQTKPQWGHTDAKFTWPMSKQETDAKVCILSFNIPNDISPPILFYYRLTNFYQNHRRYVKSVDIEQLKGTARTANDIRSGDCAPLDVDADGKPYYPCGLIANSMFNDSFDNFVALNPAASDGTDTSKTTFYNFTTNGTSWAHEGDLYGKTAYTKDQVAVPPYWKDQYPSDGYATVGLPDLHTWEQFQVWMRTAGLPTFSKLAQRNDNEVLKAGTYWLKIYDCRTGVPTPAHVSC